MARWQSMGQGDYQVLATFQMLSGSYLHFILPDLHNSSTKCAFVTVPFPDEEIEAQRGWITHMSHPIGKWRSWGPASPVARLTSPHCHFYAMPPCPVVKAPPPSILLTLSPSKELCSKVRRQSRRPDLTLTSCECGLSSPSLISNGHLYPEGCCEH